MAAKNNNNKDFFNQTKTEEISLMFKDHKDFFDRYYELRTKVNDLLSDFLLDTSVRKELLRNLSKFINWSANYVKDIKKLREDYFELTTFNGDKINKSETKKEFYDKVLLIWDNINTDNQIFELLPKPDVKINDSEEEKFWKEESHVGLKQIKKGFIDILSIKKD